MNRVEILYFDGCPTWRDAVRRVHHVLVAASIDGDATVTLTPVETEADAQRLSFLGSPTIRVNGRDVDASAGEIGDFALQCRLYRVGSRFEGLPPTAWIASALGVAAPPESPTLGEGCGGGGCR